MVGGEEGVKKEIFEATGQYILQWWIQGGVGWGMEDVEKEIFEATGRYILQWWIQGEVGRGGCRKGNIRSYRSVYSPVVDPGWGGERRM